MLQTLLQPHIIIKKFLRGAVICKMMSTQGNRDAFSARLKQSGVSVQVARVAAGNWFQSCGPNTANAHWPYYLSRHVERRGRRRCLSVIAGTAWLHWQQHKSSRRYTTATPTTQLKQCNRLKINRWHTGSQWNTSRNAAVIRLNFGICSEVSSHIQDQLETVQNSWWAAHQNGIAVVQPGRNENVNECSHSWRRKWSTTNTYVPVSIFDTVCNYTGWSRKVTPSDISKTSY